MRAICILYLAGCVGLHCAFDLGLETAQRGYTRPHGSSGVLGGSQSLCYHTGVRGGVLFGAGFAMWFEVILVISTRAVR